MKSLYNIVVLIIICSAHSVYAYSVGTVKISPDGNIDWNYIIGDQNYGGMDLDMAYDGSKFIYLSTTELIRINEFGTDDISKDISSYYLTPDMEGSIYFIESFDNVAKVDSSLSYLWKTDYLSLNVEFNPEHIFTDSMNNLLVEGWDSTEDDYKINNFKIIKYNKSGEKIWDQEFSQDSSLWIFGIYENNEGQILLPGTANDVIFVAIYEPNGNFEEIKYYEIFNYEDFAYNSFADFYFAELGVRKYSSDCELQWHFSKNEITVKELSLDSDENIIGIGTVPFDFKNNEPENLVTFKLDPNGNLLWWKKYEHNSVSVKRLLIDGEDNVIVTGYEGKKDVEIPYDTKFFALKLNPDGELLWHETYQPFEGYSAFASDAVLDDEDNIYIAGYSYDYTDGDDDDEPGCGCF